MCYIPDPVEILERRIELQIDLVDKNGTYPCCKCGRRFPVDEMYLTSIDPSSSLECGLDDCNEIVTENKHE